MKLKNVSKKTTYRVSVAVVGIVVGLSIQFVRAWTPPKGIAPNGEVIAPILTSGGQHIAGTLTVDHLVVTNGTVDHLVVTNGTGDITLGGIPKSAWPAANIASGSYAPGSKLYVAPGYSIFTVPANVNMLHVEVWGGGGGGAVGRSTSYNGKRIVTGGSGGASGGYIYGDVAVTPEDNYSIFVGKGGSGESNVDRNADTNTQNNYLSYGNSSNFVKISYAYDDFILFAAGGAGGFDFDNRYTGGDVNGIHFCTDGWNPKGGKSSNSSYATGVLMIAGNDALNCVNDNGDNRPGGAGIANPARSNAAHGAGGNGRYWGKDPNWVCDVPAGNDPNMGTSWDAYSFDAGLSAENPHPWDPSSCTINIPGIIPTSNDGSDGAVSITW